MFSNLRLDISPLSCEEERIVSPLSLLSSPISILESSFSLSKRTVSNCSAEYYNASGKLTLELADVKDDEGSLTPVLKFPCNKFSRTSAEDELRAMIRRVSDSHRASVYVQIGPMLGKGNSGSVVKAISLIDHKLFALKRIYVNNKSNRSQLLKEVWAFNAIKSQYLVSYHGAIMEEEDEEITCVLEYMNRGSLQNVIDRYGSVQDEYTLKRISKMILLGLRDIHRANHVHRDIKPGNIVLDHKGNVKITDFGVVKDLSRSAKAANTFVGTQVYMSPERLEHKQYSYSSDIWSFGLTLITLASGKFPYEGIMNGGFAYLFYTVTQTSPPKIPTDLQHTFSNQFLDFVEKCLQKDPSRRLTTEQLLNHEFLRDVDISPAKDGEVFQWIWESSKPRTEEDMIEDSDSEAELDIEYGYKPVRGRRSSAAELGITVTQHSEIEEIIEVLYSRTSVFEASSREARQELYQKIADGWGTTSDVVDAVAERLLEKRFQS